MKQLVCPISNEYVNERITRLNALFTILLVFAGFIVNSALFPLFLMMDFYIRGFTKSKFSPVSFTSLSLANILRLNERPIAKAPKIFAARLGFLMTLIISALFIFDLKTAALTVAGMLVFFASLEFIFGVCMGCIFYTYVVLPFFKS